MTSDVGASDENCKERNYISRSWVVWIIFLIWGFGIYSLAKDGGLPSPVGQPPWGNLMALFGPPTLFMIAYKTFAPLRAYVRTLDVAELTALQAWRVVGASFLFGWSL